MCVCWWRERERETESSYFVDVDLWNRNLENVSALSSSSFNSSRFRNISTYLGIVILPSLNSSYSLNRRNAVFFFNISLSLIKWLNEWMNEWICIYSLYIYEEIEIFGKSFNLNDLRFLSLSLSYQIEWVNESVYIFTLLKNMKILKIWILKISPLSLSLSLSTGF